MLNRDIWLCCLNYFHIFNLYYIVTLLLSLFSLFYIFVRTTASFLNFTYFMQTPVRNNLSCPVQLLWILHLIYVILALFSACILTHSCHRITLAIVTGWIIRWSYIDSCFQPHWLVVTIQILDMWLPKRWSSLVIHLHAWGEQITFMKLRKY